MITVFKIIAIDPSTTALGMAMLEIDSTTMTIKDIETLCINPRVSPRMETLKDMNGYMRNLYNQLKTVIEYHQPLAVSYERPFMNRIRPTAYGPLMRSISVVIDSVLDFNHETLICEFSPAEVKVAMGAKGGCNKEVMLEACLRNDVINSFLDPYSITNDEIDAIAVGFCFINSYKNRKILLA